MFDPGQAKDLWARTAARLQAWTARIRLQGSKLLAAAAGNAKNLCARTATRLQAWTARTRLQNSKLLAAAAGNAKNLWARTSPRLQAWTARLRLRSSKLLAAAAGNAKQLWARIAPRLQAWTARLKPPRPEPPASESEETTSIWSRISTQLQTSFGGAVLLIISISLIAIFVLNYIKDIQNEISEKSMPEMQSAFSIAQQTATLVAAAPQLATVDTLEQFRRIEDDIRRQEEEFAADLTAAMEKQADRARAQRIQERGNLILLDIAHIKELVRKRFELRQQSMELVDELSAIRDDLIQVLNNEIDTQMFYTITGYRSLDWAPAPRTEHFSEEEFRTYRHLVELREAVTLATQLLATAFTVTDARRLQPLQEQFDAAVGLANRSLGALSEHSLYTRLSTFSLRLFSIGRRENSGFDLHGQELAVDSELSRLLSESRALGVEIGELVEGLVGEYSTAAIGMAEKATNITETSATLLLIINIVSIIGAILIGWFFVERHLIRRLGSISMQIQRIAAGNLEIPIEVSGRDEIGQLAKALEVFRQNALEIQRLSLVEQLADELKEMYQDLEKSNEQLKKAQDQVVMQEKLAALGELTAGVAHEIKNPMNFIMNFAQVSQDLMEELLEEVRKTRPGAKPKEAYDPALVEEIAGDLTGNLKRIQEHGTRANRIVVDMLKMGRHDSGEWQPTDLGVLLNQHTMLAFHSARASNPDFQLDIQEDYAPDVGEVVMKPQDLGRVFLNLVTNACYATNEKRQALAAAGDGADYQPTLSLSTRLDGDRVEVHVRDNGSGIPEAALKQIFNPFFTTKPPDRGTGLGLSLSSDIVREHGGEFRVDTREGEYTEMVVVLPLDPAAAHAEPEDAGDADTAEPPAESGPEAAA